MKNAQTILDMIKQLSKIKFRIDNTRVLNKNVLYWYKIPLNMDYHTYFNRHGKVLKIIIINQVKDLAAYVTYINSEQAAKKMLENHNNQNEDYPSCMYGTIKYCKHFLNKTECKKLPQCPYLHLKDRKNEVIINLHTITEIRQYHLQIARQIVQDLVENKQKINIIQIQNNQQVKIDLQDQNSIQINHQTIQHNDTKTKLISSNTVSLGIIRKMVRQHTSQLFKDQNTHHMVKYESFIKYFTSLV